MHIPDGYLSPSTCAVLGAAMVPVWAVSVRRVKQLARSRSAPLLAIGAAYCFLVMMFNVPIPDGTTAHAVGGVLIAILLGRWAAVIAVSVALGLQALFFGDGGVLAFGANCFNMAFVLPFVGYGAYLLLSRGSSLTDRRRVFAAGAGAYIGLNAAALCAAVEFGLQPDLFHTANGTPLYAPFHLSQTIPAMAIAHLTVAGFVEFALTAGVVAYLQRAQLPLLRINHPGVRAAGPSVAALPGWRWAFYGLIAMMALSPLGLLAPGGAFGEDSPADLNLNEYHLSGVPQGLNDYAGFWSHTVLGGYGFSDGSHQYLGYVLSAFIGALAVAAAIGLIVAGARFSGRDREGAPAAEAA